MNGSLSHEDLSKLGNEQKTDSSANSRDTTRARAKATADSAELVKALQLSCTVKNAQLVVSGTRKAASGSKEVDTRVYEVACAEGMGYLLEAQGSEKPVGISCLTAEEARASDTTQGKTPGFFCKLPENKDVYSLVASLITTGAGASCTVRNIQQFGRSESTHSDYSEVVCADGKGFLLRMPLPGSQAPTVVMSCTEAAKQGIKCRLTDGGPIGTQVTMETFKSALAHNGVSCKIDQIRMIGQEDNRKRYVIEYRCADQPTGMVAYIPLEGNVNPYESLTCVAATLRDIFCKFSPSN